MHKAFKACTAVLLALVMTVSLVNGALAAVVRNDDDTISYEPLEQGVYSKGGYTIDKVSHPTLGAGEVDGILTGDLQDRGQSYSWSMAEAGDYVYIGTCYNSTYYIYHNNVKTSLDAMKKAGKLDQNVDTSRAAADFVKVMFGTDTFDETPMSQWTPVIMAVNRYTGEAQVIFRERDILKDYPDIFPGYPPYLKGVNYLAGYRMAFEFKGKIYFAGMGNPTATLIDSDELHTFQKKLPEHVLLVVDEAYIDFVEDPNYRTMVDAIADDENLIVVRTFSKLYGMAGARMGYLMANREIIEYLQRDSTGFCCSRMGLHAAEAALDDVEFQEMTKKGNQEGREILVSCMKELGFRVWPSHTNFIYFDPGVDVKWFADRLLDYGIIIRGNFKANRISIGTPEEDRFVCKAMREIMANR